MGKLANIHKPKRDTLFAWFIFTLGALFYCYEYLLRISPSIMATDLMRTYHLDAAAFGNLVAFYYYAYTPMQLPVGILMDRYGPRCLLIFATLSCSIGTYLFAGTHEFTLWLAKLGRFLVGFGSAFAFVGVLKLATLWLPANRFAFVAGLTTSLGMLGGMVGDISLSKLVEAQGWQNTILSSALLGILLTFIISFTIPSSRLAQDKNHYSPLNDFQQLWSDLVKLLKNKYIWLNGIVGCLLYLSLTAFGELWGVPYLENAFRYTPTEAANLISLIFLGWAIGGPLMGWISDKIQRRRLPIMIGSLLTTLLFSLIFYAPILHKNLLALLLFFAGVASSTQIIVFAIAREISPPTLAATALAFTNMIVMFGGMLAQPLVGLLLNIKWSGKIVDGVHIYSAADYQFALTLVPIGAAIVVLTLFFMKETHGRLSDQ